MQRARRPYLIAAVVALGLALALGGDAQGQGSNVQGFPAGSGALPIKVSGLQQTGTLFNSVSTAVAASITVTIAGVANTSASLQRVDAFCSPAGSATITVTDTTATLTLWQTNGAEVLSTALTRFVNQWNYALTAATGDTMTIVLSSCGAGNTGTLIVQAERY